MILYKYLFIVRHGHSDFDAITDKKRILTAKGQQAVNLTSEYIIDKAQDYKLKLNKIISSDASRTIETSEIIKNHLNITDIEISSDLYSTTASHWIDKIINSNSTNLVLVGHNPTLSQLVNRLTGSQCFMNPANCAFIKLAIKHNEIFFPAELLGYLNNE